MAGNTIFNPRVAATLREEVYQSNLFIQAKKKFDLLGMKLFLIALGGVNPHFSSKDKYFDEEFKMVFIPTSKLTELLGGSKYLGLIPKACLKLELAYVKLEDSDDPDKKLRRLFQYVDYKPREGLYVCFNDALRPHLLDLLYTKGYTGVRMRYLLKLSSVYAMRLLELLLQFQNIHHFKEAMEIDRKLTIEELRFMLNVPEGAYKGRIDNFKRHVLDVPMNEINERTPYFLRYKPVKKGKKIIAFKFMLSTHKVPPKISGRKPQWGNEAVDYLCELGFSDIAARAIYEKCRDVTDCFVRANRAQVLLRAQKTPVRNRLGFLRKAIEENWHGFNMPREVSKYQPGWTAIYDYHHKPEGYPKRRSRKKDVVPESTVVRLNDALDSELVDAVAQGEFYTPADPAAEERERQVAADGRANDYGDKSIDNAEERERYVAADGRANDYGDKSLDSAEEQERHVAADGRANDYGDKSLDSAEEQERHVAADGRANDYGDKSIDNAEERERHVATDNRVNDYGDKSLDNAEERERHVATDNRVNDYGDELPGIDRGRYTAEDWERQRKHYKNDIGSFSLLSDIVQDRVEKLKAARAQKAETSNANSSDDAQPTSPTSEQAIKPVDTDNAAVQKKSAVEVAINGIAALKEVYKQVEKRSTEAEKALQEEYERDREAHKPRYLILNGRRISARVLETSLTHIDDPSMRATIDDFFKDYNTTISEGIKVYMEAFGTLPKQIIRPPDTEDNSNNNAK